jgi:hypothetical protein
MKRQIKFLWLRRMDLVKAEMKPSAFPTARGFRQCAELSNGTSLVPAIRGPTIPEQ